MIARFLMWLFGPCGVRGYDMDGAFIGYCYLHLHHLGNHESHGGPFRD